MTPDQRADFRKLCNTPAFQSFVWSIIRDAGLLSPSSPSRSLEYAEGRRSMAVEMLQAIEAVQLSHSADGQPVAAAIQILSAVPQIAAKENTLGRRSDEYRDIDGDDG